MLYEISMYLHQYFYVNNILSRPVLVVDCSINVHENSCKEQSPICDKHRQNIRVRTRLIVRYMFVAS